MLTPWSSVCCSRSGNPCFVLKDFILFSSSVLMLRPRGAFDCVWYCHPHPFQNKTFRFWKCRHPWDIKGEQTNWSVMLEPNRLGSYHLWCQTGLLVETMAWRIRFIIRVKSLAIAITEKSTTLQWHIIVRYIYLLCFWGCRCGTHCTACSWKINKSTLKSLPIPCVGV